MLWAVGERAQGDLCSDRRVTALQPPMPFVGSGRWCSFARRVGWGRSDSLGSVQPRSLLSSSEGLAQLRAAEGCTPWPPDAVSKQR